MKRPPLKVRELLSPDVVTLSPEDTLRDAIEVLTNRRVSGAPVLAGNRVVGVVSATDILDFEASNPGVPAERVDQMEWGEPGAPSEWEEADSPAAYYTEMWSDAGADVLQRFQNPQGPEWDVLGEHTVSEVMTQSLQTLEPEADVHEAAAAMLAAGVHRLLVTQGGRLVGILTMTDIVRAVAERRL
jgi:CBS domain-containing protein